VPINFVTSSNVVSFCKDTMIAGVAINVNRHANSYSNKSIIFRFVYCHESNIGLKNKSFSNEMVGIVELEKK